MNARHTLINQIGCLRVEHNHLPATDLPQAGRLSHYLTNWSAISQDQCVLSTKYGTGLQHRLLWQYHTTDLANPSTLLLRAGCSDTRRNSKSPIATEQVALIQEEIASLLQQQTKHNYVVELLLVTDHIFGPQKDGGQKSVIN